MAVRPGTPPVLFISGWCGNGACDDTRATRPINQRCAYEYANGRKREAVLVGKKMVETGDLKVEYIRCACSCHHRVYGEITKKNCKSFEPVIDHPVEILPLYRPTSSVSASVTRVIRSDPKPAKVLPERTSVPIHATPTGRRNRGGLEGQVTEVCNRYVQGDLEAPEGMTPKFISKIVGGVKPPSHGAINAVFDRWERTGFASIGRKPVRFLGYLATDEVTADSQDVPVTLDIDEESD